MTEPSQLAAVLQYGAMGLLALMLVGVAWYVRATMQQQTAREESACRERAEQLKAWIGLVQTIALLNEKLDAHTAETIRRHDKIDVDLDSLKRLVGAAR